MNITLPRTQLYQTEITLIAGSVKRGIDVTVSYIYVPKDDGVGYQVELLNVLAPNVGIKGTEHDLMWALPLEIQNAIIGEIEEVNK